MKGSAELAQGRIKEAAGALSGNNQLRASGRMDQAVGRVKQAGEKGVREVKDSARKNIKAYSILAPKSRDDDSIHTYGSRVCARARVIMGSLVLAMTVTVPYGTLLAAGTEPVDLGTAAPFGVLSGAAISGTGHIKGDVGAVGAIAPAITSTGTIYPDGPAVVTTALDDFFTAYDEGKTRAYDVELSDAAYELGGTTLTPGVYRIGAAATLATPVTLDAEGDPEAVFIIQIVGALGTTASTGNVLLANGAQSANIFWVVEGAVSTGAGTHMEGTILGGAGIAFGADTTINGRLLAGSAAGTIAMATTVSVPVDPSVVGGRVWFDENINGIQDPEETTGFPDVPVTLLQLVFEKLTIDLGTAANFGALAGAAITGTGHIEGDVGSGTGAIAPAITSDGEIYSTGHAAVMTALDDFDTAYSDGKGRAYDVELSDAAYELGGTTLTPGVYKIGAAATLATPVTLDAEGDPEAVFIIQIVGAFGTTAATGNVNLINEAASANVFWIVDGAVSLGADTHMEGTILGGATITFGATTTISGRALAGTAAGTIALATTVSAATGTPPEGYPPPFVVAETATDAEGNYLFEGVQPGTLIVRWDLSSITTDFRITEAHQGDDDTLDSDGVSGDVGEYVYTMEIEVPAGTTHLSVDLGLVETLPAIKMAALADLDTALAAYLLENYYTEENREALITAKEDGDAAINAATDPEGVAAARDAALAAMDAVPTYAETLAEAKAAALDDLDTALAAYLEADYTAENWTTLNTAKTDGDAAINAATDLAGVASAMDAALAAMDAVPTIAESESPTPTSSTTPTPVPSATSALTPKPSPTSTIIKCFRVSGVITERATTLPAANAQVRAVVPGGVSAVGVASETGAYQVSVCTHIPAGSLRVAARKKGHIPNSAESSYVDWTDVAGVDIELAFSYVDERPAGGDYDGDGTSDIAIFRPSIGLWAIRGVTRVYFGDNGDDLVPGDYDGDGTTDVAVFRGATGLWAVRGITRIYFGSILDVAVPGDYTGDGTCDLAIFRNPTGLWAVRGGNRLYFGSRYDEAVVGDYSGDGLPDAAVYRASNGLWAIRGVTRTYFGSSSDTPVPGDYDGDGIWNQAIFRPSSGLWAVKGVTRVYFGGIADEPIPGGYRGDGKDYIGIFRGTSGLWAIKGVTRTYFGSGSDVPVVR